MATYNFEDSKEYQELRTEFICKNGREPNDLDKVTLSNQLVLNLLCKLRKQEIINLARDACS